MFSSGHKNHKKTKIFVLDRNITNKCFQTETLKVKKKKKKYIYGHHNSEAEDSGLLGWIPGICQVE